MADEKLDKDPDLRQAQDLIDEQKLQPKVTLPWWKQVPWWYWILALIFIFLGARLGRFLADGWGLNSWGTEHWGPVASWFASVATVAAVVVALRQANIAAKQAKDAAKQARADSALADKRHKADLKAADDRLSNELDAKRRHDQAILVAQIWKSSSKLNQICENLLTSLFNENGATTSASKQRVETLHSSLIDAERDLDDSLSDANLLVTDSETRQSLQGIQKHADELLAKVEALYVSHIAENGLNQKTYDSAREHREAFHKRINKLMGIARRNITRVPSLRPEEDEIES